MSLKHHQLGKHYPLARDQSNEKPQKVEWSIPKAAQRIQHPKRTISLPRLGLSERNRLEGFFFNELTHRISVPCYATQILEEEVWVLITLLSTQKEMRDPELVGKRVCGFSSYGFVASLQAEVPRYH